MIPLRDMAKVTFPLYPRGKNKEHSKTCMVQGLFLKLKAKGKNTLRSLNGSLQTSTINDGQHKGNHQAPVVAVSRVSKHFGLN